MKKNFNGILDHGTTILLSIVYEIAGNLILRLVPTQGWSKVGARLGQGLRQCLAEVWARSGPGLGKVRARSGQKARFG